MIITTIVLFLYVINAIGLWKMFEKAGIFGLWSFVPLLNVWLLFKIVYGTGIASLALLIPIINFFQYQSQHLQKTNRKIFNRW